MLHSVGDETSTQPGGGWLPSGSPSAARAPGLGLVLAWSSVEPTRVGEVAILPATGERVLGRGSPRDDDRAPRVPFVRHRPGPREPGGWLTNPGLSRQQLLLRTQGGRVLVERIGRVPVRVRGRSADRAELEPGDVLLVERELVLLCIPVDPSAYGGGRAVAEFPFGDDGHVLVTGPSGAGKELCARGIHERSARQKRPFVARNAATLPAGLIDAELFGNAKNFPNPGMRERAGLIGEADGGTLFLDEIGELPEGLQAHLLRVLDAGEYHRLGDDQARRADVRLVAATNREETTLKHDLLARLKLRIDVPGLDERREDIPLLVRTILRRIAKSDVQVESRFFERGEPRVDPELVAALLEHGFATHVRELESLLLLAMAGATEGYVPLTAAVKKRLTPAEHRREVPTREEIEATLARLNGNVSRAYKDLGLASRDVLNRLLKKHGIVVRRE
jgi:MoxR-like ATPase